MFRELRQLLISCSPHAKQDEYRIAAVDANILGKPTMAARQRTFGYLRELYSLDVNNREFRCLRALWDRDLRAQPLLAMLCALSRDSALRGTCKAIVAARQGIDVTSSDLAQSVKDSVPGRYDDASAARIGRNALSSWTQSGHLLAPNRNRKIRSTACCTLETATYALYLGHLDGEAGQRLFTTEFVAALDREVATVKDFAFRAAGSGLLEYREAGGLVEIGFRQFELCVA